MKNIAFRQKQFEILRTNRILILEIIEKLSLDRLNNIPEGYKNFHLGILLSLKTHD